LTEVKRFFHSFLVVVFGTQGSAYAATLGLRFAGQMGSYAQRALALRSVRNL
jgi:hypothetical protein